MRFLGSQSVPFGIGKVTDMLIKQSRSILTVLIALTLIAPSGAAQAADPAAFGTVSSTTGTAIADVRVDALQNSSVVASATTDSNGNYAINLPEGTYELRYTSPTAEFTSLQSLPIDLPQNWPLNVILSAPSVGKVFLKGFFGLDGGAPAVSIDNPGDVFCNNGGNSTDINGYFTLSAAAGSSCQLSFDGSQKYSNTDWLGFYLSKGPTLSLNQDTYIDAVTPMTTTKIRVVNSAGKLLTAADGLEFVRLEVGGEMTWQQTKMVGDQLTVGQARKVFPEGKVSMFTGLQDFTASWRAQTAPDAAGEINVKRVAMTSGIQGVATVYFKDNYVSGAGQEVTINATGGIITLVATPKNVVTASGKIVYSDGKPVTSGYVGTGIQGVNTGSQIATDGTYRATFPNGSASTGMEISTPTIKYPNGSTLSYEFYISYKTLVINSSFIQDFTIPAPTTQQVRVLDGNGNPLPNATVQIGRYYTNEKLNRGDPSYPLTPNLPKSRMNWSATATADANGLATVPAMQMSAPQQMWVTAAPNGSSVWSPINKLMTIGNGSITVQLESRTWKVTGSVKSSENFPIITPTVMALTASGGGGNYADANGNFSLTVKDAVPITYSITSRKNDIVNPDPLMFNLTQQGGAVTPKSDITQHFVLPVSYQNVKVVDPAGAPIIGTKVVLRVATDEKSPANIVVAPNLPAFVGSYTGYSTTGIDGFATVPGLVNNQLLAATLYILPDNNSRYLPKTVNIQVGDRKDIVIALAIKPPAITSITPSSVKVGETIVVRGSGFLGATGVTIGSISANYAVISATQINVFPPSNAVGGAITVTNAAGSASFGNVTITQTPLSITTSSLPGATQGTTYSTTLAATGGTMPYKWSRVALGLPNGLNINDSGVISGVPLQAGNWSFTLGVSDTTGATVTRNFTISVAADPKFLPGTPSNLKASPAGSRINVSWNATISDNGNPITGYVIQFSTNATSWANAVSNTRSSTPSASFSVIPGTYYVRVAAINASGTGAFSAPSSPVLIASAPNRPISVALSISGTSITATWTASSDNGSPISGYRIRYSQDGINWITQISDTKTTATTYTFVSPVKGKVYVQVAAINAINLGRYASAPNFVTAP